MNNVVKFFARGNSWFEFTSYVRVASHSRLSLPDHWDCLGLRIFQEYR
jgi:hypothetical protein